MANGEQQQGVYTQSLIAFEDAYKTDPSDLATRAISLPFNSNALTATQNKTDPSTITGRRDPVEPIMGNIDVAGQLVAPVDGTSFGYWLMAIFDEPTTTAGDTGGTYKHVFKPSRRQPSLIIEKSFPDIGVYAKYSGCKVNTMSITVGGDGELTANIDMTGANETILDATISSSPRTLNFDRFSNFMASFKINGELVAICTEVSMEMNMNLDGDTYAIGGKGFRAALNEGILNLSGSMTAFFTDDTFIKYAEESTTISAEILFETGDFSLSFLYPEMKISRNTPSIDGPTGIKQTLDYSAFYKENAQNSSVVVTLINKTEKYTKTVEA